VIDELPLADVETSARAVRRPSPLDCSGFDLSKSDLGSVEPKMPDDNNEELRDVTHSLPRAPLFHEVLQVKLAFGCERRRVVVGNGGLPRE
jgi:hypothetical protein